MGIIMSNNQCIRINSLSEYSPAEIPVKTSSCMKQQEIKCESHNHALSVPAADNQSSPNSYISQNFRNHRDFSISEILWLTCILIKLIQCGHCTMHFIFKNLTNPMLLVTNDSQDYHEYCPYFNHSNGWKNLEWRHYIASILLWCENVLTLFLRALKSILSQIIHWSALNLTVQNIRCNIYPHTKQWIKNALVIRYKNYYVISNIQVEINVLEF